MEEFIQRIRTFAKVGTLCKGENLGGELFLLRLFFLLSIFTISIVSS